MALDKLGNPTLQKKGGQSSNQTHDQKTHKLLSDMKTELTLIRMALMEMSGLEIEQRDIEEENL